MKSLFRSVSLIDDQDSVGYIIIAAFIISIIVTLLGNKSLPLKKGYLIGTLIPGIIPGIILLLIMAGRASDNIMNFMTSFEIGFYIVLIASAAILLFGLTLKEYTASVITTAIQKEKIFCMKCGKEYPSESAGDYCENCGNKL
jgi:uncharacterized membrane protein YjjB (DUF3815 family)